MKAKKIFKVLIFTLLLPFRPLLLLGEWLADTVREVYRRYKLYLPTLWYFGKPFALSLGVFCVSLIGFIMLRAYALFWSFNWFYLFLTVITLITFIIFMRCAWGFVLPFWFIHKVFEHEREIGEKGRVILYDGAPGTGKSLSMTYDFFYLACMSWGNQLFEYLYKTSQLRRRAAEFSSLEDYWQFEVVKETVEYYLQHPEKIPLLISNYAIQSGQRYSSPLDMRAFLQLSRLPEGASIVMDEYADKLSNQRSNASLLGGEPELMAENLKLSETFSKERHYGDWYIGGAEQEAGEGFIGLRRVVSINRYLESCVKVCEPVRLINRRARIRRKVLKRFAKGYAKEECCKPRWARKLIKLDRRIPRIGFFYIEHTDYGNSQKGKKALNSGYYCLPRNLPFKYATRAYQFEYDGYKCPLELENYYSLYMPSRPDPEPPKPDIEDVLGYDEIKREEKFWKMFKAQKTNIDERLKNPDYYDRYF